jgi:hypothetical protein
MKDDFFLRVFSHFFIFKLDTQFRKALKKKSKKNNSITIFPGIQE